MEERKFTITISGTEEMIERFVNEIEECAGYPNEELDLTDTYGYSCTMLDFYSVEIKEAFEDWKVCTTCSKITPKGADCTNVRL